MTIFWCNSFSMIIIIYIYDKVDMKNLLGNIEFEDRFKNNLTAFL